MKTYTLKAKEIEPHWHVLDATDRPLGRLASEIAHLLRGKHRPTFTPHMDNGDHVVVVNASKVRLTGRKLEQKRYYRHSGYPGGLKEIPAAKLLGQHPERVVQLAVRGMLPHNRLGRQLLRHLKVYGGPDHPHHAQVNAGKRGGEGAASEHGPATTGEAASEESA